MVAHSRHLQHRRCVSATDSGFAEALRDRYTLERELGRGGMAVVFLARDLRHRRYVALKRLPPELASAVGIERFEREIHHAASLQHPNILPVHDSGDAAGALWYTMPYVDGESLRDRLRRESRIEVEEAVSLAREIAEALECAHSAGIIHRDIKPENIMLSRGHALVMDFGIARAVHDAGEMLTETGLVIGTPAYMSPEQAGATGQAVDGRSDLYSLGCVLYEMLAGERPFAGATPQAMIARRMMEAPPDPRLACPAVPEAVASAVMRSLAADPEGRFATAGELAAALQPGSLRHMPEARPNTAVTKKAALRWRSLRTIAVATLLVGVAGAAWLTRHARPPHRALDDTLVAVAPFEVLDPSLALWHEGLMDVLSRTLDGAGPLRTVSPAVVSRQWGGRADRASAAALAHATGAARVLYGSIIPAGSDSVRLIAVLHDARNESTVSEFDLQGRRDRIDRLTDSLTLLALRSLSPATALAAPAGSPIGTASLAALKAFLEGEQHFRRSEFDSAQPAFRKAVTVDSQFGLAWHRLSQSTQWRDSSENNRTQDRLIAEAAFRAAAAHGLATRDSLVLTADSLFWGLFAIQGDPVRLDQRFWQYHTRLFATLGEAQRRFPEDPEVVLAAAEGGWQWGGIVGQPFETTLRLYDRAIALDSAFTPSYPHAAFIALAMGDPARAVRYVQAHLRWGPSASVRGVLQLLEALLTPGPRPAARAERLLDSLPLYALEKAFGLLGMSADSGEAVIRVLRKLASRRPAEQWSFGLGVALAARGHLHETLKAAQREPYLFGWLAQLATEAIPEDSLRRFRSRWLAVGDSFADTVPPYLQWLAEQGDTAALTHLVRVAKSKDLATVTRAFLALAHHDTAGAISWFHAFPDSSLPLWTDTRLTKARLLRQTGQLQEAARVLRPTLSPWGSDYYPADGLWHLERGRTYEQLDDTVSARQAYHTVLDLWRHADPELQSVVTEAREALARLHAGSE
jgi:eukaryotic-like serine/threonine-protein kinase